MIIADDFLAPAVLPIDSNSTTFAEVGTGPGGNPNSGLSSGSSLNRFYWED